MTKTIASAVLALAALPALAQTDLSRPGALDRLKADQPSHYEAVAEIARVGQTLGCSEQDVEQLKTRYPIGKLDCGFVNNNSTPPSRRLRFEIDGASYMLTVRISDTAPKLIGR